GGDALHSRSRQRPSGMPCIAPAEPAEAFDDPTTALQDVLHGSRGPDEGSSRVGRGARRRVSWGGPGTVVSQNPRMPAFPFALRLPRIPTAPFCPSEVRGSVEVRPGAPFWQRVLRFAGPGLLVAVGYMDPGNWATDIEAGSVFGYSLLFVVLLSSLAAIV